MDAESTKSPRYEALTDWHTTRRGCQKSSRIGSLSPPHQWYPSGWRMTHWSENAAPYRRYLTSSSPLSSIPPLTPQPPGNLGSHCGSSNGHGKWTLHTSARSSERASKQGITQQDGNKQQCA